MQHHDDLAVAAAAAKSPGDKSVSLAGWFEFDQRARKIVSLLNDNRFFGRKIQPRNLTKTDYRVTLN